MAGFGCPPRPTKWKDAKKLLAVYENRLGWLEEQHELQPDYPYYKQRFSRLLRDVRKDGFEFQKGHLVAVGFTPPVEEIENVAASLEAPYIQKQLERIRNAVQDDPALAIGTAKELVETVCKTILRERGKPAPAKTDDVMKLVKLVREDLELTPDHIPDAAKAAQTIKRLLSNLANIVQGLAELRNPYGTGHGPDGKLLGLQPRHARLASQCAAALTTFLIETHHDRKD